MPENIVLGIDFGTSKSVLSIMKDRVPIIIPDEKGHEYIPSVVMVSPKNEIFIGWDAINHPQRYESQFITINSIKRSLGKENEQNWGAYRTYPQEISALILARLKNIAETYCNQPISQAVIAVPAHYDINQRWATIQAAEIAGLKVVRLINEASAALLSCRNLYDLDNGNALVFDFGAGTLDVSIINYGQKVFEVLATAGDDKLGGDDFDQKIIEFLLKKIKQQFPSFRGLTDGQYLVLREAASKTKIELSSVHSAQVSLPGFLKSDAGYHDLNVEITQDIFEKLLYDLYDRTKLILNQAIQDARLKEPLNVVYLVGGTSRIPLIIDLVSQTTKYATSKKIDSMFGVAKGACMMAGILSRTTGAFMLLDTVPSTYSIETLGSVATPLVERNSTIPLYRSHVFSTTADKQTEINVRLFQGERPMVADDIYIGSIFMRGIPPAPKGIPQIEVEINIDENNTINVSATDKATGQKVESVLESPHRLNTAQINLIKQKVQSVVQAHQQRDFESNEMPLNHEERKKAAALALRVETFLQDYANVLMPDAQNMLSAGAKVIHDYINWETPRKELHALVSSVTDTFYETTASAAAQYLVTLAEDPQLIDLISEVPKVWNDPVGIKSLMERFFTNIPAQTSFIVDLLGSHEDVLLQQKIISRIQTTVKNSAVPLTFFALILLNKQPLVEIPANIIQFENTQELHLYIFYLLFILNHTGLQAEKRMAAAQIYNLFKGRECLFLLQHYQTLQDSIAADWLRKCFEEMPVEGWLKFFKDANPERIVAIKQDERIVLIMRKILTASFNTQDDGSKKQTLAALEQIGMGDSAAVLLEYLENCRDEKILLALIALFRKEEVLQAVYPLIKLYVHQPGVRLQAAVLKALRDLNAKMDADMQKVTTIVLNCHEKGTKPNLAEKIFLGRMTRSNPELKGVVSDLQHLNAKQHA